jgi:curved DNA-binding protein CbpA
MTISYTSYYQLLGVPESAAPEDITAAFRRLALVHHPDQNRNSPASEALFKLLVNARDVLADPHQRAEYDACLKASNALRGWMAAARERPTRTALPPAADGSPAFAEAVLQQLNILLWDIEDFLREHNESDWNEVYDGRPLAASIVRVLVFIDEWILHPAGQPDYFWRARGENGPERKAYFAALREGVPGRSGHWGVYVNMTDYFYNIRKRMNDVIARARAGDLMTIIAGDNLRIIDAVFEAQGLAMHALCHLRSLFAGEAEEEIPYRFRHAAFGE